jgi:hypothetical protein
MAFFSKTNVMITIFAKTSSSWSKKKFAKFFGENILKIITSVPDDVVKMSNKMQPNQLFVAKIIVYLLQ